MKTHFPAEDMPATKRRILDCGIDLMRMKGFNATSVGEICKAAGVTKGAFFHYFPTKEDLTKEAAALFGREQFLAYQAAGFMDLPDPLERIYGRLEFLMSHERAQRVYSCLIGTLAQEVATTHPDLREIFHGVFTRMTTALESDLAAAKALYAPKAEFEPATLASMFISMFQGSLMIAKADGTNDVIVRNVGGFRDCLKMLFAVSVPVSRKARTVSSAAR